MINSEGHSIKSDIWSIGCILYEMCTCEYVFADRKISDIIEKIKKHDLPKLIDNNYHQDIKSIISK